MGDYDVLFAVVLRVTDFDGKGMEKKMDKATIRLGEVISDEFEDCAVIPVGFEKVVEGEFLQILNHFEFRQDVEADDRE